MTEVRHELIARGRGTGRTTELIVRAAEADARGEFSYIVCHSHAEAYRIAKQANAMGLSISFPLTYDEFLERRWTARICNFYVDNVEVLLQKIGCGRVRAMVVETKSENG